MLVVATAGASPAAARMRSTKLDRHLCKTVHGGRFVAIPGFPGEKIDRRLIPDIRWMKRRFDIFITDGYSNDPVHAGNGEHPIGLATDIVPNRSVGGTWGEIGELAHLAEPSQNHPIAPWRWVGWNGTPAMAAATTSTSPGRTRRASRGTRLGSSTREGAPGPTTTSRHRHHRNRDTGGTSPTSGSGDGSAPPNGAIPSNAKIAPAVPDK